MTNQTLRAIIVDDEPKAIELLKNYLQYFNGIELIETFRNGLKAFEFLSKNQIDLVFLDINMPHISGISLSKMIDTPTKIIFTTAYSEYAVESYEVEAIDYLLKPISLERFTKSIGKVFASLEKQNEQSTKEEEFILVKSGSKLYQIQLTSIFFLEKEGNYMTYHTKSQKIVARQSIQEALENLSSAFIQVHKSFVVNINKIETVDKEIIKSKDIDIPIGASFKQNFFDIFLAKRK